MANKFWDIFRGRNNQNNQASSAGVTPGAAPAASPAFTAQGTNQIQPVQQPVQTQPANQIYTYNSGVTGNRQWAIDNQEEYARQYRLAQQAGVSQDDFFKQLANGTRWTSQPANQPKISQYDSGVRGTRQMAMDDMDSYRQQYQLAKQLGYNDKDFIQAWTGGTRWKLGGNTLMDAAQNGQGKTAAESVRSFFADNAVGDAMADRRLQKLTEKYGSATFDDNFIGQFRANYGAGKLSQEYGLAWSDYMDNPTPENRAYVEQLQSLYQNFLQNNAAALDNEGTVAKWLSKDIAAYIPQFLNQTKTSLPFMAPGAALGAKAGAAGGSLFGPAGTVGGTIGGAIAGVGPGIVAGSGLYSYDIMRGMAFANLLETGADEVTAKAAANDEALVSSVIEMGDTAVDLLTTGLAKIPGVGGAIDAVKAKAAKVAVPKLLKAIGVYAGNVGQEYGEEFIQEILSMANARRVQKGQADSGIDGLIKEAIDLVNEMRQGGAQEELSQAKEAGRGGAVIGAVMGPVHGAVNRVMTNAQTNAVRSRFDSFLADGEEAVAAKLDDMPDEDLRRNLNLAVGVGHEEMANAIRQELTRRNQDTNVTDTEVQQAVQEAARTIPDESNSSVPTSEPSVTRPSTGQQNVTPTADAEFTTQAVTQPVASEVGSEPAMAEQAVSVEETPVEATAEQTVPASESTEQTVPGAPVETPSAAVASEVAEQAEQATQPNTKPENKMFMVTVRRQLQFLEQAFTAYQANTPNSVIQAEQKRRTDFLRKMTDLELSRYLEYAKQENYQGAAQMIQAEIDRRAYRKEVNQGYQPKPGDSPQDMQRAEAERRSRFGHQPEAGDNWATNSNVKVDESGRPKMPPKRSRRQTKAEEQRTWFGPTDNSRQMENEYAGPSDYTVISPLTNDPIPSSLDIRDIQGYAEWNGIGDEELDSILSDIAKDIEEYGYAAVFGHKPSKAEYARAKALIEATNEAFGVIYLIRSTEIKGNDNKTTATFEPVNIDKLSAKQRDIIKAVDSISKLLGIKVAIGQTRSTLGGAYVGGGKIYLNINAGVDIQGFSKAIAAASFGHELTHWLKDASPKEYETLKQTMKGTLTTEQWNVLIDEQLTMQRGLTRPQAEDEVLANACQRLLQDSNAFQEIARENRPLAEKILDFLKEFAEKIRKAFADVDFKDDIKIFHAAQAIEGYVDSMQKVFDDALVAASKSPKSDSGNTAQFQESFSEALDETFPANELYEEEAPPSSTNDENAPPTRTGFTPAKNFAEAAERTMDDTEYGKWRDEMHAAADKVNGIEFHDEAKTVANPKLKDSRAYANYTKTIETFRKKFSDVADGKLEGGDFAKVYADMEKSAMNGYYDPIVAAQWDRVSKLWDTIVGDPDYGRNGYTGKDVTLRYTRELGRAMSMTAATMNRTNEVMAQRVRLTESAVSHKFKNTGKGLVGSVARFLARYQINPTNVFRMIDGFTRSRHSEGYKYQQRIDKATAANQKIIAKAQLRFAEIKQMKGFKDFAYGKDSFTLNTAAGEINLNQQQAVALLKELRTLNATKISAGTRLNTIDGFAILNSKGDSRFIEIEDLLGETGDARKLSAAASNLMAEIESGLSDVAKAYLETTNEVFDELKGQDAAVYKRMFGVDKYMYGKGDYMPVKYIAKNKGDINNIDDTIDFGVSDQRFMHERERAAGGYVAVQNVSSVVDSYINQAANYIAYAELGADLQTMNRETLFGDSLVKVMKENFGKDFADWMTNYINDVNNFNPKDDTDGLNALLRKGRLALQTGALMGSVSVPIKQISSYWSAMGILKPEAVRKAYRLKFVRESGAGKNNLLLQYRKVTGSDPAISEVLNNNGLWAKMSSKSKILQQIGNAIPVMDYRTVDNLYAATILDVRMDNPGMDINSDEFQQLVDSKFEEVVLNTQPIFTRNARAEYARTNNEIIKLLAMFRTQQTQNLNRLITTIGEYKASKGTANEFSRMTTMRNTIKGQATAAVSLGLLTIAADIILHRKKKYDEDKDEKMDAEALFKRLGLNAVEGAAGTAWFGDQITKWAIDAMSGGETSEFYGLNLGIVSTIADVMESVTNFAKNPTPSNARYAAGYIAQTMGIPLNNAYLMLNGAAMWMKDALGDNDEHYDDILKYLQTKYSKQNRFVSAYLSGNTQKANRLYSAMGSKAETNVKGAVRTAYMKDRMDSGTAQNLLVQYGGMDSDDAEKRIYRYDFDEEFPDAAFSDGDNVSDAFAYKYYTIMAPAGIGVNTWLDSYEAYKQFKAAKDADGNTVESVKTQAVDYIASLPLSDSQKAAMYVGFGYQSSSSPFENRPASVSMDDWLSAYKTFGALKSDKDANGKTVKSKQTKVTEYINSLKLSKEQKNALWKAFGYSTTTAAYRNRPWR